MFIKLKKLFFQVKNFIKISLVKKLKIVITVVTSLIGLLLALSNIGWLNKIYLFIEKFFIWIVGFISIEFVGLSILGWLIIIVLIIYLYFQGLKVNIVAGEFRDDFDKGLGNWEFGGEGWKIELEDDKQLLSVSQSGDGGITKRGFAWSDYEFNSEVKVINKSVGFIVRAENRNRYIMIQLNLEDPEKPMLRLHARVLPKGKYDWFVLKEDVIKGISTYEWLKVKIIVYGSNIDVYINNEHKVHYFIADPLRLPYEEQVIIIEQEEEGEREIETKIRKPFGVESYLIGSVGFRCSGEEHAHIRKVMVKPNF